MDDDIPRALFHGPQHVLVSTTRPWADYVSGLAGVPAREAMVGYRRTLDLFDIAYEHAKALELEVIWPHLGHGVVQITPIHDDDGSLYGVEASFLAVVPAATPR
jgi:hypothetical protein